MRLKVGDWMCTNCGVFSFVGRRACWRCGAVEADMTQPHVVTEEHLIQKFGSNKKCWPKRDGPRWDKHPAQPEDVRNARTEVRIMSCHE